MPTLGFTGAFGVPGIDDTRETYEDQIWREHFDVNRPFRSQDMIDGVSVDAGNTNRTSTLRAGLLMGRREGDTAGDNKGYTLAPWNPAATDGTQKIYGPLLVTINMLNLGATDDKLVGWVLSGGLIRERSIIIPGETDAGLEGKALGNLVRESMANSGRFRFDDGVHDWQGNNYKMIETVSAAKTLTNRDSGMAFVLTSGAVVTLPPAAGSQGLKFTFYGGSGGGSIAEAAGGDLLPSSPQTVAANVKREVIGLDGTNYLATGAVALT